jgi:phosphopantothenoylcysteine synthetase/decarboxylase
VTGRALTLVACGAPLAGRARDVQAALTAAGWSVTLVVTEAGSAWAGQSDGSGPRAGVLVACPLTFNTANKVASGIMDTPASGALCDALGAGRLVAVPMVNERLWAHPIWAVTIDRLSSWGVTLVDPSDGRVGAPRPVASGTGAALAAAFDPRWVVDAVGPARPCG